MGGLAGEADRLRSIAAWIDTLPPVQCTSVGVGSVIGFHPVSLADAEALIAVLESPVKDYSTDTSFTVTGMSPVGRVDVWLQRRWVTKERPVDVVDEWASRLSGAAVASGSEPVSVGSEEQV